MDVKGLLSCPVSHNGASEACLGAAGPQLELPEQSDRAQGGDRRGALASEQEEGRLGWGGGCGQGLRLLRMKDSVEAGLGERFPCVLEPKQAFPRGFLVH